MKAKKDKADNIFNINTQIQVRQEQTTVIPSDFDDFSEYNPRNNNYDELID